MEYLISRNFLLVLLVSALLFYPSLASGPCVGSALCTVCVDCSRCRHCSVQGQTCGSCSSNSSQPPQASSLEHPGFMEELYGFKLWQLNKAISLEIGEPVKQIQQGNVTYDIYQVGSSFEFIVGRVGARPHNAVILQLTRTSMDMSSLDMPSFCGLTLGDGKDRVLSRFRGSLSEKKLNEKQTFLNAETSNFSLVLTDDRLTSIRIETSESFLDTPETLVTADLVSRLIQAVPEPAELAQNLHPFGEVSYGGKAHAILVSFSSLRKETPSNILLKLKTIEPSIQGFHPVQDSRLEMNLGVGVNFKYPPPCKVEKLTFMPYNGRYCLYEAWFRD